MSNIEKLRNFRHKEVKITLSSGVVVKCKPLHRLEEDYDSYVVEVLENTEHLQIDQLIEVAEEDLLKVELVGE